MKKKIYLILIQLLLIFFGNKLDAQCASSGSITTTTTTTPNTCAGNGTITATFSSVINTTIQLVKGGSILQSVVNPTSPYTFTTLQAGTDYQVKVICSIDNSTIYSNNSNITVEDNYVPITNADISVSKVCTNFLPGGTITVNRVTGGTAPYQYSIIKNDNAGYDDTLSSYSTSPTKNVAVSGTYQIRVKDACGGFKTFTKTIPVTQDPIRFYWRSQEICGSSQVQGSGWFIINNITGASLTEATFLPLGIKLKIQADNAAGAVLFDGIYTGPPFTYTPSASHKYYVTATNACGASVTYMHNLTDITNSPEFLNFVPTASTADCGASETETLSVNFEVQYYWKFPVSIVVKNSLGKTVNTTLNFKGGIWTLPGLSPDTYTITVSDSCSPPKSITKKINNPTAAGAPVLSLDSTPNWRCAGETMVLSQPGTIQALVSISGYFPDAANAVVTIIAGPSNVGINATFIDGQYWGWANLTVGTYTVSYTSCGVSHTGTFTIANNTTVLIQSLTSTAVSTCNSGGSITSTSVYNGASPYIVQLLDNAGTVIDSNATGNFSNLVPGTYTTRLFIQPCNLPSAYYYIPGSTVIISDSTTGAFIGSAVGVICEDASGNPLSTGTAYIDLNGVAPYTVTYRVKGSGSVYTTINNISSSSIVINNLTANTVYEVNLSDACGTNANTTVQIKTMGNISGSNTVQPCKDSPYALTMPYYSGAVYEWINPQGTVVSNTRIYSIANYNSSYDGTYVCKINWGNCVTRFVNVNLNSSLCGGTIGDACYKPATKVGTVLPSNHGITSLGRAGADNGNWPMLRNGAWTVLEAKTKGFVINRIATSAAVSAISNPVIGMMVYDAEADCLKINTDGTTTGWKCFNTQACP